MRRSNRSSSKTQFPNGLPFAVLLPSLPPFSRWPNIFSALILGANRPRAIELCGPQKGNRSHAALRCSYPRPLPIPKYSVFRIPHDSLRLRSSVQSVGLSSNQSIDPLAKKRQLLARSVSRSPKKLFSVRIDCVSSALAARSSGHWETVHTT